MNNIKLAIPFKLNNDEMNETCSEFNIRFSKEDNSLDKLIEFIQEYENKRINIEFPKGIHMPTLVTLGKIHDQIYVRVTESDLHKVNELQEKEIKFFLDSTLPVVNFTHLNAYIALGVTDIYIADDLCYQLDDVREMCNKYNIRLRLILDKIPMTSFDAGGNVKSHMYRPQELSYIDEYFDVYEFDAARKEEWNVANVLYRVWFKREGWHGQLNQINKDVGIDYPTDAIVPEYISYKLNCERVCDKRAKNHCRKCQQFMEIAYELRDMNIALENKRA